MLRSDEETKRVETGRKDENKGEMSLIPTLEERKRAGEGERELFSNTHGIRERECKVTSSIYSPSNKEQCKLDRCF